MLSVILATCLAFQEEMPRTVRPAEKYWTQPAVPPTRVPRNIFQWYFLTVEVMDPREIPNLLVNPKDFEQDFAMLMKRYDDLKDVPLLCNRPPLPDRGTANECIIFNREVLEFFKKKEALFPAQKEYWKAAVAECENCYSVWDKIRDVECEYYYVHIRRQALKALIRITAERPSATFPPPHVPLKYFAEVR